MYNKGPRKGSEAEEKRCDGEEEGNEQGGKEEGNMLSSYAVMSPLGVTHAKQCVA